MAAARTRSRLVFRTVCAAVLSLQARPVAAQTLTDVLSFLLTNRSIATDDFVRDTAAAAATRDAFSAFLLAELGTLPVSSSAGGFTYRLEPTLGTTIRSSENFGPFLTERSLTGGRRQISVGISYQRAGYGQIDGQNLRDGSLVATASRLEGDSQPFDAETLTLKLHTDTMTVRGTVGVTDRLDIGAALPLVRVRLEGERVDTYRGRRSLQALASGDSSGPGDLLVRSKYNLSSPGPSGVAVAVEARLPTGNEANLHGTGQATIAPSIIGSLERARAAVHATAGYAFGGLTRELHFAGAGTLVTSPRLTLVGELVGRRLASVGRLIETTAPHPTLSNVLTLRLTSADTATTRLLALAGLKWNIDSTWLLNAHVMRSMTYAGLSGGWTPTITIDRTLGR
jgi:hypothetical protein